MSFAQDITSSAPAHRSRDQWPLRWGVTSSAPYTRARGASHVAFSQFPRDNSANRLPAAGNYLSLHLTPPLNGPGCPASSERVDRTIFAPFTLFRDFCVRTVRSRRIVGLSAGAKRTVVPPVSVRGQRYRPHIAQRRNQYLLQRPTNRIGRRLAHVFGRKTPAGRAEPPG